MNKNPIRIIPFLDIKNGLLIKGVNLEGLRVLGKARDFSNHYYKNGADEICYIDDVATLYGTNNLSKFITETAKDVFIPLSVGGGIRTLQDITNMLSRNFKKKIKNNNFMYGPPGASKKIIKILKKTNLTNLEKKIFLA